MLAFVGTGGLYTVGSSRAFGYDAAVTVGNFVATPSLADPFQRQVVLNNHVLFSFLEHLVYTTTGSRSEAVLRVLPTAAAAAVVALVAFLAARRWGLLGGLGGAAVVAMNPLFLGEGRDVRGYTLMTLCALVSTLLFVRLARREDRVTNVGYVLVTAAGLGVHLYMALVVAGQIVWAVASGWRLQRWVRRWVWAGVLGAAVYVGVVGDMGQAGGRHAFHATFPIHLVKDLLGVNWWTAVLVGAVVAPAAARALRGRPDRAVAAAGVGTVGLLWLAVRPLYLYSRFFVWAVPLVGLAVAATVARRRPAIVLVAIALVLTVVDVWPHYGDDDYAFRAAAAAVARTRAHGGVPCSLGLSSEPLVGYTRRFRAVGRTTDVAGCTTAVWLVPDKPGRPLAAAARRELPVRRTLPAITPGTLYCRTALDCKVALDGSA